MNPSSVLSRFLAVAVAVNLFCQPVAAAIPFQLNAADHAGSVSQPPTLFLSQAVVPALNWDITPIFNTAKIQITQFIWRGTAAVTPLLPYLAAFFSFNEFWGLGAASGAAMFPPNQTPLERMQTEIESLAHSPNKHPWAGTSIFVKKYFSPLPHLSPAKATEIHNQNTAFFDWLRKTEDEKIRFIGALVDIQLAASGAPYRIYSLETALRIIQVTFPDEAKNDLREIAYECYLLAAHEPIEEDESRSEFIASAAALDTLLDMGAVDELAKFSQRIDMRVTPINRIPLIPILARADLEKTHDHVNRPGVIEALQSLFPTLSRHHSETALHLLALHPASPEAAKELLKHIRIPDGWTHEQFHLYVMISMLAILQVVTDPALLETPLTPQQLQDHRREITRTHWEEPQYELQDSLSLSSISYQLGQLLYRDPEERALSGYMVYLFEMMTRRFFPATNEGPFSHRHLQENDEEQIMAAQAEGSVIQNPAEAARIQFAAIIRAAVLLGLDSLPWDRIYKLTAPLYLAGFSLRQVGRMNILNFVGEGVDPQQFSSGAQSPQKQGAGGTSVFLPRIFAPSRGSFAIHRKFEIPSSDDSDEAIWNAFMLGFYPTFASERHIDDAKYLQRFATPRGWNYTMDIIHGREKTLLYDYFENHPTEQCHLHCKWCKGDLRTHPDPKDEMSLQASAMIEDVQLAHEIGRGWLPVRLSGEIGDPTKHKDLWKVIQIANELGQPYNLTTNGLSVPRRVLDQVFSTHPRSSAQWWRISLDAGVKKIVNGKPIYDEAGYVLDKDPEEAFRSSPMARVMRNLDALDHRRRQSKLPIKIIVSYLIQESNAKGIEHLVPILKAKGVDMFLVIMQHEDPRRTMQEQTINDLYTTLAHLIAHYDDDTFTISVVYDQETALQKNRGLIQIARSPQDVTAAKVPSKGFKYCAALFYAHVRKATNKLSACCQPDDQSLGVIADLSIPGQDLLSKVKAFAEIDTTEICGACSPSDDFTNRFVDLLRRASPQVLRRVQRALFILYQARQDYHGHRRTLRAAGAPREFSHINFNLTQKLIRQNVHVIAALGSPGIGKTQVIEGIRQELNAFLIHSPQFLHHSEMTPYGVFDMGETLKLLYRYLGRELLTRKQQRLAKGVIAQVWDNNLHNASRALSSAADGNPIPDVLANAIAQAALKIDPELQHADRLFLIGYPGTLAQLNFIQNGNLLWKRKPLTIDLAAVFIAPHADLLHESSEGWGRSSLRPAHVQARRLDAYAPSETALLPMLHSELRDKVLFIDARKEVSESRTSVERIREQLISKMERHLTSENNGVYRNLATAMAMQSYYASTPWLGHLFALPFKMQWHYLTKHGLSWAGRIRVDGHMELNKRLNAYMYSWVLLHELGHQFIARAYRTLGWELSTEAEEIRASAFDLVSWVPAILITPFIYVWRRMPNAAGLGVGGGGRRERGVGNSFSPGRHAGKLLASA